MRVVLHTVVIYKVVILWAYRQKHKQIFYSYQRSLFRIYAWAPDGKEVY